MPKRTIVIVVAAVIVVGLSASVAVLSGRGPPPGPTTRYNVTFEETTLSGYGSGWIRYGATASLDFNVTDTNLSSVYFTFSWSDTLGSPLQNPTVSLTLTAPNGTIIYDGPAPTQPKNWTLSMNEPPENGTVPADSPAAAIQRAAPQLNETLGEGLWNYTVKVGTIPFARNQIRSGINFNDDFGWTYINASARVVPA